MAEHGTPARYKKHVRDKDEACRACKDATAASQRELLNSNPILLEETRRKKRAVSRAATRLKNLYLVEWEVFYQEELRKEYGTRASE